jgi:hypothetical protein
MTTLNNLSKLLESDLEQARLIFATNDVVDRLQSMAEQIAKMSVNDVMPIVDDMRGTFGPEKADTFEAAVNEALDAALEAIKSSKDKVANEVLRLEGKAAPEATGPSDLENDAMAAAEPSEETGAEDTEGSDMADDAGGDTEEELDDIFGGSDDGVGRAKKESAKISSKKAKIMEAKRALRKKIAETARKLQAIKEGKLSGKAKEEFLARMGKSPKKDAKPADKECKKGDKECEKELDEGKIPAGLKAYQDKKAGKKVAKPADKKCKK